MRAGNDVNDTKDSLGIKVILVLRENHEGFVF